MKICMLGLFNYATDARVKRYAESLLRAGIPVDVLSVLKFAGNPAFDSRGVRIFSIVLHRTRKNRITYLLEYGTTFLLLAVLLTRLFIKERYDLIHVHNMPDFLVFTAVVPKLFGAKILLDIHDPMPEVYMSKFPDAKNGLGICLVRWQEAASASFADMVITSSVRFRQNLIARGIPSSKIAAVHNVPDPNTFDRSAYATRKGKRHGRFTLVFPGTIAPRYGLDVAIRALPKIRSRIRNVKLLIIGHQGEYTKTLISLATQLGVASTVEFRPVIPNEEIPELLAGADIGIYTALRDPHMSIAVPSKLLEFALMGLPAISSRLQIVEEMFGASGVMYFEPGDSNQFAECVLKLHDNPKLREDLVRNADRIVVRRYTWAREFVVYWSVLARLFPGKLRRMNLRRPGGKAA